MLKNMKIRKKLILAFLLVTIVSSISSLIGLINMLGTKPRASSQIAQSATQQGSPAIFMIAIVIASFIISFLIAMKISGDFSKPIIEMTKAAEKMAQGDLSVQFPAKSKDEIGQLGEALSESNSSIKAYIADLSDNLGKMAQGDLQITRSLEYKGDFIELADSMHNIIVSLNVTLSEIHQASEQVSSGSNQVSDGAQALAQGATEQASSIQELSATIIEVSQNVKQNAEYATSASLNVNHVSSQLEASNQHMQEMLTAMSKISDSSNEIGKIIKTIEDIAFQTNILALNAAVEAARAGAAGKGFAVVADEVRNLASKSAEAAKNTTSLIENSIAQVENGIKIADITASALLKVVDDTKTVSKTVNQIAQTSNQQASSINQINLGVEQISSVVQTNSATAEESAAASEELSSQAETMKVLVGKFKLKQQDNQIGSQPQRKLNSERMQPEQLQLAYSKY